MKPSKVQACISRSSAMRTRRSAACPPSPSGRRRPALARCRSRHGIGVYSTVATAAESQTYRRSDRHVGGTGVGGQRIDQPYLRPADGGTPGLRCAVWRLRAAGAAGQSAGARRVGAAQMLLAVKASARLGLSEAGHPGSLAAYLFPFPQRPEGLIDTAFDELAGRWLPVLNACDEQGSTCVTKFTRARICTTVRHSKCFMSTSAIIRAAGCCSIRAIWCCSSSTIWSLSISIRRLSACSTSKDAEFNPTGRQGIYGGYQSRIDRAGRFRSLGDGGVDSAASFHA